MNTENRINSLPDPLIHHIFSFLDTESVIPTSLLSKRWRYLWTSNPYLTFNYYYSPPPSDLAIDLDSPSPYPVSDFLDFVDRILISRDASPILKFNLVCEEKIHKSRVLTWLIATLIRNVQDLDLVLLVDQPIEFPYNLFANNSLREFKLSGYFGDVNIRLPISVCFCSKIRVLELDFVKLPEGDCNGEIEFSCEVLEELVLSRCEIEHLRVVTVSGKRIRKLKMISSYENPEFFCRINVVAPELRSLMVSCDTRWGFCLEDFGVLNDAEMAVGGDDMNKEWMMKFLRGIGNVRYLAVSAEFFQAIADSPDILVMLPGLFHNLRVLTVETGSNNFAYLNRAISNILKTLPSLESFALKRYEDTTASNVDEASEDWGKSMPVDCKFNSLKVVKIYNPRMTEDEAKFMLFILERAMHLKEILFIIPHKNVNQINVEPVTIHRPTSDVLVHLRRGAAEA